MPTSASRSNPMIGSSENRFFTSNLRRLGNRTTSRRATQNRGDVNDAAQRSGKVTSFLLISPIRQPDRKEWRGANRSRHSPPTRRRPTLTALDARQSIKSPAIAEGGLLRCNQSDQSNRSRSRSWFRMCSLIHVRSTFSTRTVTCSSSSSNQSVRSSSGPSVGRGGTTTTASRSGM